MQVQVIAQVVAIVIIAGFLVYKEVREKAKLDEYELLENPKRCWEHKMAINELRADIKAIKTHLGIV